MKVDLLNCSVVLLLCLISSCGGGTSGTGTTEIYGSIRTLENEPVVGAQVSIFQTGDSTTTNDLGEFSLETKEYNTLTELEVVSSTGTDRFQVIDPEGENSRIEVKINIDKENGKISKIESLEVSAGIYGACDRYFENHKIIRQSNKLAVGTVCTVKVWMYGDGKPLANANFILEAHGCANINPWKLESSGKTRDTGVGQLTFEFKNDPAHCEYRIIAPHNYPGLRSKIFEIHPFTKQEYDKNNS
jgi:hypothetical protein